MFTQPPSTITATAFIEGALRTAKRFREPPMDLIHAALGLCSEAGELTEPRLVVPAGHAPTATTHAMMREELGDLYWFLVYALYSWHLGDVSSRYCHGGTDEVVSVIQGDVGPDSEVWAVPGFSRISSTPLTDLTSHLAALYVTTANYATLIKAVVVYGKPTTNQVVFAHLADIGVMLNRVVWYLGFDRNTLWAENNTKLRKRFPAAFTDSDAIARADKADHP